MTTNRLARPHPPRPAPEGRWPTAGGHDPPRRAQPNATRTPADPNRPGQNPQVALLAAEALSLVVRAFSPHQAVRLLADKAEADRGLLIAAARSCRQIDQLSRPLREQAADLLRRAATLAFEPPPGADSPSQPSCDTGNVGTGNLDTGNG